MLNGLEARAREIGAARAAQVREGLAGMLREGLPERDVEIDGEAIGISGAKPWDDPRLRWIGSMWR